MRLWILRPRADLDPSNNPWEPWYDRCFGFIVRAFDEAQARSLAAEQPGSEVRMEWDEEAETSRVVLNPWLHAEYSTCAELTADGAAEVVMSDVHAA